MNQPHETLHCKIRCCDCLLSCCLGFGSGFETPRVSAQINHMKPYVVKLGISDCMLGFCFGFESRFQTLRVSAQINPK
jgi:hypothetical protein